MLHDGAAAARVTRCRELIETRLECSRESLLNIVERSISAEREREFAGVGGPPKVLRTDNGREPISQALRSFSAGKVGLSYISLGRRGATANRIVQQPATKRAPHPQPLDQAARNAILNCGAKLYQRIPGLSDRRSGETASIHFH